MRHSQHHLDRIAQGVAIVQGELLVSRQTGASTMQSCDATCQQVARAHRISSCTTALTTTTVEVESDSFHCLHAATD
jgi:hypothetical protein